MPDDRVEYFPFDQREPVAHMDGRGGLEELLGVGGEIAHRRSSVVQFICRVSQKVDGKQLFFDPTPKSPTFDLLGSDRQR